MNDPMFCWSFISLASLLMLVAAHACFLTICILNLQRRALWTGNPDSNARTMVVVCLRGDDPNLKRHLLAATQLNHANYFIRAIIDNKFDPAFAIVDEVIDSIGTDQIEVQVLRQHYQTCSLKCSALIQALSDIPEAVEYVAFMDADTEPHPDWLDQLLAPLAQHPSVAVVTGNRWYMPNRISLGTMTRYVWNAGALSQMITIGLPWGGTLAVRRSFAEHNMLGNLRNAFCEDIMLRKLVCLADQDVYFAPELLMVNREDCDWRDIMPWISRQLLTIRLHDPAWPLVFVLAVVPSLIWFSTGACAVGCLLAGKWLPLAVTVTGSAFSLLVMFCELMAMEAAVRRVFRNSGRAVDKWLSLRALVCCLVTICGLQFIYPMAALRTALMRRVTWRGIEYSICRDRSVFLRDYRPFESERTELPGPIVSMLDEVEGFGVEASSRTASIY